MKKYNVLTSKAVGIETCKKYMFFLIFQGNLSSQYSDKNRNVSGVLSSTGSKSEPSCWYVFVSVWFVVKKI